VQHRAFRRQFQPAHTAPEKRHAQLLFQRLNLPADGRLRQEQFCGRLGEAQVARRRIEALEGIQRRQFRKLSFMIFTHACNAESSFVLRTCREYRASTGKTDDARNAWRIR
jgi:hypothetical protein